MAHETLPGIQFPITPAVGNPLPAVKNRWGVRPDSRSSGSIRRRMLACWACRLSLVDAPCRVELAVEDFRIVDEDFRSSPAQCAAHGSVCRAPSSRSRLLSGSTSTTS